LKRRAQGETTVKILAHPALEDVQVRLRDGKAEWHSFDEVFSD